MPTPARACALNCAASTPFPQPSLVIRRKTADRDLTVVVVGQIFGVNTKDFGPGVRQLARVASTLTNIKRTAPSSWRNRQPILGFLFLQHRPP
jgi:hypothetical protein